MYPSVLSLASCKSQGTVGDHGYDHRRCTSGRLQSSRLAYVQGDLSLFPRGHVLQTAGERYATSGEQLHPDCSYRLETVRCYGEVKS